MTTATTRLVNVIATMAMPIPTNVSVPHSNTNSDDIF